MNPLKETAKLNRDIINQISAELGVPEEKVPRLVELLSEALKPQLGEFVGRRSFLGSMAGLGAATLAMGIASAKTKITGDNVVIDDQWYLKAPMPFSALVGIDGSKVIAYDWKGKVISEGVAGVDDASVIQSAVNISGKIVLVGSFVISNSISLVSDLHLVILPETTIKAADGYQFNLFHTDGGIENIIIEGGGKFDGNWVNTTDAVNDSLQNMIYFGNANGNCKNVKIKDLIFLDAKGIGVWGVEGLEISGVKATMSSNIYYPIHLHSASNVIIENNTIDCGGVAQHGIGLWSTINYMRVANNYIKNASQYEIHIRYTGTSNQLYTDKSVISMNHVIATTIGINVKTDSTAHLIISENIVEGGSKGINVVGKAIIESNRLLANGYGIFTTGSDFIITGNYIENSTTYGIYLYPANNSIIAFNRIINPTYYGIRLRDSTGSVLLGNKIVGGTIHLYAYGSSDCIVVFNELSSISGITDSLIRHNKGYSTVKTKASNYSATWADGLILVDASTGAITITLPDPTKYPGEAITVKKIDASANAVTVSPYGTETIDGGASYSLSSQNQFITLISDGTNWYVVASG